ncbi:unnamed protein product [Sphagnum troendelagicum]|uniref:Uncharacterized protein n=1 Tax=Sphagnum troendelagicum TaxID=128251 RepID=A0ABP0UFY8_9BRYO
MKLPPTSSANTATRNDAQAKEADRKREPPAMVEYHTIPSQNVTDARPLCSYGYCCSQIPDHYALTAMEKGSDSRPLCTYGYGKRAQIPGHYAVTDIGVFRLQTNHALMAMEGLRLYTIMQFTGVEH